MLMEERRRQVIMSSGKVIPWMDLLNSASASGSRFWCAAHLARAKRWKTLRARHGRTMTRYVVCKAQEVVSVTQEGVWQEQTRPV
jgi:hypothetical protein